VDGEADVVIRFENQEDVVLDTLKQGSFYGSMSILSEAPIQYFLVAKTNIRA